MKYFLSDAEKFRGYLDPRSLLPLDSTTTDGHSASSQESGGTDTMDPPNGSYENLRIGEGVPEQPSSPTRYHNPFSTLIGPESTTGIQFLHEHHHDENGAQTADDSAAKLRKKFKKVVTCCFCSNVECGRLLITSEQCGNYKAGRHCILAELLQNPDWIIEPWMWMDLMDLPKLLSLITLPDDVARQKK